jgi:hypothetical protein
MNEEMQLNETIPQEKQFIWRIEFHKSRAEMLITMAAPSKA